MRRREFITLLGGAATAWPLAARAQLSKLPVVGVLYQVSTDTGSHPYIADFGQGLRDLGYVEGQNVIVQWRPARRAEQLPEFAAELVRRSVDVIVAAGSQAVQAARQATRSIPIVMTSSSDPIGTGFVESLARPGGNITGLSLLSTDLSGKRLQLLKEVVPGLGSVGVLWNPDDPPAALSLKETQTAAEALGLSTHVVEVRVPDDFERAFASFSTARVQAIDLLSAPIMQNYAQQIAMLALKSRMPTIQNSNAFSEAGGLMSYGPKYADLYRRAAFYVDKLLKGAKPSDLPVEQPTRFELVVNLKTAKVLGLTVPPSLLVAADGVIE
jgi:putative tryptophan/tyrosine transport system substrate-binding protein